MTIASSIRHMGVESHDHLCIIQERKLNGMLFEVSKCHPHTTNNRDAGASYDAGDYILLLVLASAIGQVVGHVHYI